LLAETN